MTGQKTGCNWQKMLQLATEKFQSLCNCNQWSGLLQLGSVQFQSFFWSSELDLQTLVCQHPLEPMGEGTVWEHLRVFIPLPTRVSYGFCTTLHYFAK